MTPLTTKENTLHIVDAVLPRLRGATFAAIAMLHNVPDWVVKSRLKRAVKLGYVTRDQVMGAPHKNRRRYVPDAEYNAHWLNRVEASCIKDANGCWLWPYMVTFKGYGQTSYRGKNVPVHRHMYKLVHGVTLSFSQQVCHTCDVRHCCNPAHLWLGTAHENQLDSAIKKRHRNARKTHCKRGHPLTDENTYVCPDGLRNCRTCGRARLRLKLGWPEHLAYSLPTVPAGQWPVSGRRGSKRRAS